VTIRAVLVGGILGVAAAAAVLYLLGNLWSSCDLGTNAAANSLTLAFLYAPAVLFTAGPAAGVAFGIAERQASRLLSYGAAVAVAIVIAGPALLIGSDFGDDYPCPAAACGPATSLSDASLPARNTLVIGQFRRLAGHARPPTASSKFPPGVCCTNG
jgi:hypothetical protein